MIVPDNRKTPSWASFEFQDPQLSSWSVAQHAATQYCILLIVSVADWRNPALLWWDSTFVTGVPGRFTTPVQ